MVVQHQFNDDYRPDEKYESNQRLPFLFLKETTAPSATSGYGKIYVKASDGLLYYLTDTGSEYLLTAGTIAGGTTIVIPDGGNTYGISVTQNDITNNPKGVTITNAGTGNALYIDQNGDTGNTATSSGAFFLDNTGNPGIGANFYSNQGSGQTGALVFMKQDNAAADFHVLRIDNDGTLPALKINQNGTIAASTSVGGAVNIINTSNSGGGFVLYSNHGASATQSLGYIRVDNTAFDRVALTIESDSLSRTTFEVTGRNTAQGVVKLTHDGDGLAGADSNVAVLSIDASGVGTAAMGLFIDATDSTTGKLMNVRNDGTEYFNITAAGLMGLNQATPTSRIHLVETVSQLAVDIAKTITNVNNGSGSLRIVDSSVVDDAGSDTKSGSVVLFQSSITQTSGTITDTCVVLNVNQLNGAATGNVVNVDNDGTGHGVFIQQDGTLASNKRAMMIDLNTDLINAGSHALLIYSDVAMTTASRQFTKIWIDDSTSVADAMMIDQDGSGRGIFLDHDDTGTNATIDIDRDGNNAAQITGLKVDVANAGAGKAVAIDITAGLFQFAGGVTGKYTAITSATTLDATHFLVNATSGTFTVTLPTAASIAGRIYIIKNSGSGTITVDGDSAETIDGNATINLVQFEVLRIMSDGANWIII